MPLSTRLNTDILRSSWNVDNENLLISVADTGKGIAPAALAHIFQPFYQAEQETVQAGTGVGLALVHRIVEVLGGKISVESTTR